MNAEDKKKIESAKSVGAPAAITLIEAITQALAYEMRADDKVLVLGEDVGVNGGVFRATAGLQQQFGPSACSIRRWTKPPSPASPSASPRRA